VDCVSHSHHAATRIPRIGQGIIRLAEDGPTRRVTVTRRAPKHHDVMGKGEGRCGGKRAPQRRD
jgi:hypothetical protein